MPITVRMDIYIYALPMLWTSNNSKGAGHRLSLVISQSSPTGDDRVCSVQYLETTRETRLLQFYYQTFYCFVLHVEEGIFISPSWDLITEWYGCDFGKGMHRKRKRSKLSKFGCMRLCSLPPPCCCRFHGLGTRPKPSSPFLNLCCLPTDLDHHLRLHYFCFPPFCSAVLNQIRVVGGASTSKSGALIALARSASFRVPRHSPTVMAARQKSTLNPEDKTGCCAWIDRANTLQVARLSPSALQEPDVFGDEGYPRD